MLRIIKTYLLYYIQDIFHVRRKPRMLQLPITSKCNSRCLTCNIWKMHERIDIDPIRLKRVFEDSFFSKVVSVGINGGEPSLHANFVTVVKAVLTLPKLKDIYIISNCINSEKLLIYLKEIYPLCVNKKVKLHLQISVDGVGEVHNYVRGIKVSFEKSIKTIEELYKNKKMYLDEFDIGCTISKHNVDYLAQIEDFFCDYNIPFYFHLAVPNKRIRNFEDAPFSVLSDQHATQIAKEFFLMKSGTAKSKIEKIRYYLIYLYLAGYTKKRMFLCSYLYQDITINENLDSFLCATASDKVGNYGQKFPSFKEYNKMVKSTKKHCDTCIHYANMPNLSGIYTYYKVKLKTFRWISNYK